MGYDQSKIRITTVRLQDEILDELEHLTHQWHLEAKRHDEGKRLSMSAVLRCVLEVVMPIVDEMYEVRNEDDFVNQLKERIGLL